jgi:hypothetical protein
MLNNGTTGRMVEHQRAENKPIDATPMNIVLTLISTNKGWFIRQALKWSAYGGSIATTWLVSHGVALSDPQAITAAIGTIAIGLIELILSKMAAPIAAK